MNRQAEFQRMYNHALDRMTQLFRDGMERERILIEALEKVKGDLQEIQAHPTIRDNAFEKQIRVIDTAFKLIDKERMNGKPAGLQTKDNG